MTLLEILLIWLVAGSLLKESAQFFNRTAHEAGQILSAALNSSS